MKSTKGITLIALIITIVVLLILAVVAIRAVQGNGIIAYAQNAATDYNQAQKDESDMLQTYLNQMDDAQNKITNNATKLIKFKVEVYNENGEPFLLEYTAKEGMTWEQWINDSNYNNGDIYIFEDNNERIVTMRAEGTVGGTVALGDDGVALDAEIIENTQYTTF